MNSKKEILYADTRRFFLYVTENLKTNHIKPYWLFTLEMTNFDCVSLFYSHLFRRNSECLPVNCSLLCWKVKITIAEEWNFTAEFASTLHFVQLLQFKSLNAMETNKLQFNAKRRKKYRKREKKYIQMKFNTFCPFLLIQWNSFIQNRWLSVGKMLWPSNFQFVWSS